MENTNKSSLHAVFNIKLHIVLVTKYRRKTLTPEPKPKPRQMAQGHPLPDRPPAPPPVRSASPNRFAREPIGLARGMRGQMFTFQHLPPHLPSHLPTPATAHQTRLPCRCMTAAKNPSVPCQSGLKRTIPWSSTALCPPSVSSAASNARASIRVNSG